MDRSRPTAPEAAPCDPLLPAANRLSTATLVLACAAALVLVAGMVLHIQRPARRDRLTPMDVARRIDLNMADAAELTLLPDIGPTLAQRIVDHRRQHGPFTAIEQITDVAGIGPATFDRVRDHVAVEAPGRERMVGQGVAQERTKKPPGREAGKAGP